MALKNLLLKEIVDDVAGYKARIAEGRIYIDSSLESLGGTLFDIARLIRVGGAEGSPYAAVLLEGSIQAFLEAFRGAVNESLKSMEARQEEIGVKLRFFEEVDQLMQSIDEVTDRIDSRKAGN